MSVWAGWLTCSYFMIRAEVHAGISDMESSALCARWFRWCRACFILGTGWLWEDMGGSGSWYRYGGVQLLLSILLPTYLPSYRYSYSYSYTYRYSYSYSLISLFFVLPPACAARFQAPGPVHSTLLPLQQGRYCQDLILTIHLFLTIFNFVILMLSFLERNLIILVL